MTIAAPAPQRSPDIQRCSLWAKAEGLSPAGSAGTPAGFLLVDWPLPWPGDLADIEGLTEVRELAAARRLRVQTTVPVEGRALRVAVYEAPADDGFAGYQGREIDVQPGPTGAVDAVRALLESKSGGAGTRITAGEVLICTHGRRDACCGSFGTTLVMELTGAGHVNAGRVSRVGAGPIDRPVRRTSHTGGHRFAPNAILLPEGTVWGFADRDLLERVTTRQGPLGDAAQRYRGCAGLPSAPLQALEAGVLAETGWALFDSARAGGPLGNDRYRLTVTPLGARSDELGGAPQAGETAVWEAHVAVGRQLMVPECGSPVADSAVGKPTTEWAVTGLTRVA